MKDRRDGARVVADNCLLICIEKVKRVRRCNDDEDKARGGAASGLLPGSAFVGPSGLPASKAI